MGVSGGLRWQGVPQCASCRTYGLLIAVTVHAGDPDIAVFVATEDTCPVDVDAHSSVSINDGSLRLDLPFTGVDGVPGSPLTFTAHYSSAADNPGTYGTQLHLLARVEDRRAGAACTSTYLAQDGYTPDWINSGEVRINGQPGVGFGYRNQEGAGNTTLCNSSRATPAAFPLDNVARGSILAPPADWCRSAAEHGCSADLEAEIGLPIVLDGSQGAFERVPFGWSCPGSAVPALSRGVHSVQAGVTIQQRSGLIRDAGYGCDQPLYLAPSADENVAKMGPNWTHSYAWHMSWERPATNSEMYVVLLAPRGGHAIYSHLRDADVTSGSFELAKHPSSLGPSCGCQGGRMYKTIRHGAAPQIVADFAAYELVREDGSRMIFTAEDVALIPAGSIPAGRLVRIEENHGRNATALTYDSDGALQQVIDAAGFRLDFGYDTTGPSKQLATVTLPGLPGDRVVTFGYTLRRLTDLRDPEQSANPLRPRHQFTYGTGLSQNDIVMRVTPDGEVLKYVYVTAGPTAGRVLTAGVYASTTASTPTHAYTYAYSDPSTGSQPERTVFVAPQELTTAPSTTYRLDGLGRVNRIIETCNAGCPSFGRVTGTADARVIKLMVSDIRYDEWGKQRSVRRYPVLQESNGSLTSLDRVHFSVACVTRGSGVFPAQSTAGLVLAVEGPTCLVDSAFGPLLLDAWDDQACDCEAFQDGKDVPGDFTPSPIGPSFEWDADVPVSGEPTLLPGATMDRLKKTIAPSERTEVAWQRAGAAGRGTRVFYWAVGNPDGQPADEVSYTCPPHYENPLPGPGCELMTYETVPGANGGDTVRPKSWTDGAGATWSFLHGADNLLSEVKAPEVGGTSYTTSFHYGPDGLVDTVTAPGGLVTSYLRNRRGQVVLITGPSPVGGGSPLQTHFTYTDEGRLRRVTDMNRPWPADPTKRTAWWVRYGGPGNVESVTRLPLTLTRGPSSVTDYFAPIPAIVAQADEQAGIHHATLKHGANLALFYQAAGVASADANRSRNLFRDGFGNLNEILITNGLSEPDWEARERACITSDPRTGEIAEVGLGMTLPDGSTPMACPFSSVTPPNVVETFDRDRAGRLRSTTSSFVLTDPPTTTWAGQHIACFDFDTWGRLVTQHDEARSAPTIAGCAAAIDAFREVIATHDIDDRIQGLTAFEGGAAHADFTFSYDDVGRPIGWFETLSERQLDYQYRPDGLLDFIHKERNAGVYEPGPRVARAYNLTYDASARLTTAVEAPASLWPALDGRIFSYTYDNNGRLRTAKLTRQVSFGEPAPLFNISYTYDDANAWNLLQRTDSVSGESSTFPTDGDDRITSAGYTYHSGIGALTTEPLSGGGTRRYRWDTAGRMLAMLEGSAGTSYTYDTFNRLVARQPVTEGAGGVLTQAGPPTFHLWNGWSQVGEMAPGASSAAFHWLNGPTGVLGVREGGTFKAVAPDHQGSLTTSWLPDPVLDPFGDVFSGTPAISLGFQGQERREAGLYYMRNRWYSAELGRFLSRDPVISSVVHNTSFVDGNPVGKADPSGLWGFFVGPSAAAEAGAIWYGAGGSGTAGAGLLFNELPFYVRPRLAGVAGVLPGLPFPGPSTPLIVPDIDWDISLPVAIAGFASSGLASYVLKWRACAPTNSHTPIIGGAYIGGGAAITFTNADYAWQLDGAAQQWSFNFSIGQIGAGVSYGSNGDTWSLTFSPPVVGWGLGAAGGSYTTFTTAGQFP